MTPPCSVWCAMPRWPMPVHPQVEVSMPPGVEFGALIPATLIVLLASLVKSTTGFGFAMVSAPLLMLMWDPVLVVPIILPLTFTVDALIVARSWRVVEPGRVVPLLVAAVVGIPLGTYALLLVPTQALKLGMAGSILIAAGMLFFGVTMTIGRERVVGALAGFLSGFLVTSTALSGPPVTLFMLNQRWAKDTFRNSLGLYFLVLDTFAIISLAFAGALYAETVAVSAVLWPPVLVGYLAAIRILPHINQPAFLRIATITVMVAALLAILNALR